MLRLKSINLTHYKTLNLPPTASIKDIKSNFRKESLNCHPDKYPNDKLKEDQFKKLSAAYQILSDVNSKRVYDRKISFEDKQRRKSFERARRRDRGEFDDDHDHDVRKTKNYTYHSYKYTTGRDPLNDHYEYRPYNRKNAFKKSWTVKILQFYFGTMFGILFIFMPIKAAYERSKSGISWKDQRRRIYQERREAMERMRREN